MSTMRPVHHRTFSVRVLFALAALGVLVTGARVTYAVERCPKVLRFDGDGAASDLDMGWTGLAHDQAMIGASLTMGVSGCVGFQRPNCATCGISGPLPNAGGNNQRCADKPWINCTSTNTALDLTSCTNQGAVGPCHFFLGPPLPLSVGGVSVCMTNEISGAVSGAVNIENGTLDPSIPLLWSVSIGLRDHPCPRCVGDPTPDDGITGGSCDGGLRSGSACDANATSPQHPFGSTSFDCPSSNQQIASFALPAVPLVSSTTGRTQTLSAASPNCRAPGFTTMRCMCDTCGNLAATPCSSNADCPSGIVCGGKRCFLGVNQGNACVNNTDCPGTCNSVPAAFNPGAPCTSSATCLGTCSGGTNNGGACNTTSACPAGSCNTSSVGCNALCGTPGEATAPNRCDDATCTPVQQCVGGANDGGDCTVASACPGGACLVGEGECAAGPVDVFCEPNTQQGCISDGDCGLACSGGANDAAACFVASECPNGTCAAATCSGFKFRECYTDNGDPLGGTVSVGGLLSPPPLGSNTAHPILGALFCMPPAVSSAANNAGGFPGLGRLVLPGTLTLAQKIKTGVSPTGGQTVSTDAPQNDGANGQDPVETVVTTVGAGTVSITEQTTTGLPPAGYRFLNEQVRITAPPATPGSRAITIKFMIDSSLFLPSTCSQSLSGLVVLKDNSTSPIQDCTTSDDPCVASRVCSTTFPTVGDGEITIHTSTASLWQLALPGGTALGKTIQIKDNDVETTKRKITVNGKSDNLITPVPGGAGDPTCAGPNGGGATLEVTGLGSGQSTTISLPCLNWVVIGDPAKHKGYKYKDKEQDQGPCKTASLTAAKGFKATCTGKVSPIAYDLTPAGEGGVAITLSTDGGASSYCAEFSAGTTATIKKDDQEMFKAKDASAPSSCGGP